MDRIIFSKLFIFCVICMSCQKVVTPVTSEFFTVISVVDGDTFHVYDRSGTDIKVRLIGLDAPETRRSTKKDIGYFGKESGEYLFQLISGRKVRLEYDIDRYDQYQRTLAYVYLEDGTFVNAELIRQGYARVMTIPPNIKYADEFLILQRKARRQGKGLWK